MASADTLLVALIVALATGFPTLAYSIWRGRKLGPKEEEALVTKTAQEAVATMGQVLDAARDERVRMEGQITADAARISTLEGEHRADHAKIVDLEARVAELEGEVESLKAA